MGSVSIINGKRGYHLKVNGLFISHAFAGDIKAIQNNVGIPSGATEWVSMVAIRRFWSKYRLIIIASTGKPYKCVWGELIPTTE